MFVTSKLAEMAVETVIDGDNNYTVFGKRSDHVMQKIVYVGGFIAGSEVEEAVHEAKAHHFEGAARETGMLLGLYVAISPGNCD